MAIVTTDRVWAQVQAAVGHFTCFSPTNTMGQSCCCCCRADIIQECLRAHFVYDDNSANFGWRLIIIPRCGNGRQPNRVSNDISRFRSCPKINLATCSTCNQEGGCQTLKNNTCLHAPLFRTVLLNVARHCPVNRTVLRWIGNYVMTGRTRSSTKQ
jgi:hypothetical protein